MKRFSLFSILAIAVALFLSGCGKSEETPVSAREKRALPPPPSRVEVTRWKQSEAKAGSYGMVVEQDGAKLTANLYTLQQGEGLVIRERASQGKYFPEQQAIIFPLYNLANKPAEEWMKIGGPYVAVPWNGPATNLVGTRMNTAEKENYNFVKLESVGPTYPTGTGAK